MMAFEPLRRVVSRALPLPQSNIDTDQILPARYLQKPRSDDFGHYLFKDLRADPAFPLERMRGAAPRIVVAGRNFGCGSSREHAVWALVDGGFRVVIAPSFGDIFQSNAAKNGLLTVTLDEPTMHALLAQAAAGGELTIDLEAQRAAGHAFEIAPFVKRCLLEGLDELAFTLQHLPQIEAFERENP
jgi:3-isopropylmalate/(R)-2-methylmalate dehydratase small subunit